MTEPHITVETVIVGASAAGLSTATCLAAAKREYRLLEAAPQVGASWRGHYDRLHLHTSRRLSALPGYPLPKDYPTYASRDQVVSYLEQYAARLPTPPQFCEPVKKIRREGGDWIITTSAGTYLSQNVVIATGNARVPNVPRWPEQDRFVGTVLHSSQYKNGKHLVGKRVLVIGFGNSGGEIAIDLTEHGATVDIAVRSAVNVIPRDVLGVPVLGIGIAMSALPPKLADALTAPIVRATVGDITKLGFRKLPYGPAEQVQRDGRIPLLDIGTIDLIRKGVITVKTDVQRFTENGVVFVDGSEEKYDAVVLATGYRARINDFLDGAGDALSESGAPKQSGVALMPGLYFCGYYVSPSGMLREIAIEARHIAKAITS